MKLIQYIVSNKTKLIETVKIVYSFALTILAIWA